MRSQLPTTLNIIAKICYESGSECPHLSSKSYNHMRQLDWTSHKVHMSKIITLPVASIDNLISKFWLDNFRYCDRFR